jgi:2,4-dienoyl-CoA reductase-like NADH-dependent reductase (Old Yellow Enzyme family)
MAFLLAIVNEVRKRIGKNLILSVKLNSADFQKGGFSEDDSIEVIKELEKAGVDLLEISGGNYEAPAMVGAVKPSTQKREAYFIEFAAKVRAASKIPLMLTGGVRTKEFGDQVIGHKEVDIIGIARPFAVAPDAGTKILSGQSLNDLPKVGRVGVMAIDGYLQLAWHNLLIRDISSGRQPDTSNVHPLYVLPRAILLISSKSATQFKENDWKWAMALLLMLSFVLVRVRQTL